MHLTPDEVVLWRHGPLALNLTVATTWAVMALLAVTARLAAGRLREGPAIPPWQHALETVVAGVAAGIRDAGLAPPGRYLPFIGTLFLFLATCALLTVVPGYHAPTASLSTTTALALAVFVAVPLYGVRAVGWKAYLRHYLEPTPVLLPLHVVGELSRTLALAVRLFGNAMSGALVVGVLLAIAPFFFPVLMGLMKLLTGTVQAYIFAVLATAYIAAAARSAPAAAPEGGAP